MATTKDETLQQIGKNALDHIRDLIAALNCDYDRLDELREEKDDWIAENVSLDDAYPQWNTEHPDEAEELAELKAAAGECTGREEAEQRIQEDALEITFRTGWMSSRDGVERDDWAEACILLTTGAPAGRIIVQLNDGEPHRAWLEVQDWGTPWTEYFEEGMSDLCLTYASVFCFE